MAPQREVASNRHYAELRPELVLLGLLIEEACHGYELHKRFEETLAGLWHISESQMYAILKRLEDKGLVMASGPEKGLAASRRVLRPTAEGRAVFNAWLSRPSPCRPRSIRLEFLTRLHFARRFEPGSLPALVEAQRVTLLAALRRGHEDGQDDGHEDGTGQGSRPGQTRRFDIASLADDFTRRQLRSALAWIDESVRVRIEEEFNEGYAGEPTR